MSTAETLDDYFSRNYKRADSHYEMTERLYYADDYTYFPVGDVVNVSDVYEGVTVGRIVGAYYRKHAVGNEMDYIIEVTLPSDHPDAIDGNGEPEHTKMFIARDTELTRRNPK